MQRRQRTSTTLCTNITLNVSQPAQEAISVLSVCSNSTTECVSWCSWSVFFPPWLEASRYRSSPPFFPPFEAANVLTVGLTRDCILSVLSYTVRRAVCCPLRVGRLWKTRHIINRRVNNFPQALLYQSLDMAAIDAWAVCVCVWWVSRPPSEPCCRPVQSERIIIPAAPPVSVSN